MSSEGKSGGKVDAVSQDNNLSQERKDALSPGREDAPSQEELLLYIRNSSYFDEAFYLEAYPDVRDSGLDPAYHYLYHGAFEGRDPGPLFSTSVYLDENADVSEAGINALLHFEMSGRHDGRAPPSPERKKPDPEAGQFLNYYNAGGPDRSTYWVFTEECPCDIHFRQYLQASGIEGKSIFHFGTGLHHFVGRGEAEQRNPNYVLGVTASVEEYNEYINMVINFPKLAIVYKVIFTDIYTFNEASLPDFDVVTLFHLCEYFDAVRSAYAPLDDRGLLNLMIGKLRPGGRIFRLFGVANLGGGSANLPGRGRRKGPG